MAFKYHYQIQNTKTKLHANHRRWIILSTAMIGLIGVSLKAKTVHADTTPNPTPSSATQSSNDDQVNIQTTSAVSVTAAQPTTANQTVQTKTPAPYQGAQYYDQFDRNHQVDTKKVVVNQTKTPKIVTAKNFQNNAQQVTIKTQQNQTIHVDRKNLQTLHYTHGELKAKLNRTRNFKVKTIKNINSYPNVNLTGQPQKIKRNTVLKVKGIEVFNKIPQFKLDNDRYITTDRTKVKLLTKQATVNVNSTKKTTTTSAITSSSSTSSITSNATSSQTMAPVELNAPTINDFTPVSNPYASSTAQSDNDSASAQSASIQASLNQASLNASIAQSQAVAQSITDSIQNSQAIANSIAQSASQQASHDASVTAMNQSITNSINAANASSVAASQNALIDSLKNSQAASTQAIIDSLNASTVQQQSLQASLNQSIVNSLNAANSAHAASQQASNAQDINSVTNADSSKAQSLINSIQASTASSQALQSSIANATQQSLINSLQASNQSSAQVILNSVQTSLHNALLSAQSSATSQSVAQSVANQQTNQNLQASQQAAINALNSSNDAKLNSLKANLNQATQQSLAALQSQAAQQASVAASQASHQLSQVDFSNTQAIASLKAANQSSFDAMVDSLTTSMQQTLQSQSVANSQNALQQSLSASTALVDQINHDQTQASQTIANLNSSNAQTTNSLLNSMQTSLQQVIANTQNSAQSQLATQSNQASTAAANSIAEIQASNQSLIASLTSNRDLTVASQQALIDSINVATSSTVNSLQLSAQNQISSQSTQNSITQSNAIAALTSSAQAQMATTSQSNQQVTQSLINSITNSMQQTINSNQATNQSQLASANAANANALQSLQASNQAVINSLTSNNQTNLNQTINSLNAAAQNSIAQLQSSAASNLAQQSSLAASTQTSLLNSLTAANQTQINALNNSNNSQVASVQSSMNAVMQASLSQQQSMATSNSIAQSTQASSALASDQAIINSLSAALQSSAQANLKAQINDLDNSLASNTFATNNKFEQEYHYNVPAGMMGNVQSIIKIGDHYNIYYAANPLFGQGGSSNWNVVQTTDFKSFINQGIAIAHNQGDWGNVNDGSIVANNQNGHLIDNNYSQQTLFAYFTSDQTNQIYQAYSNDNGLTFKPVPNDQVFNLNQTGQVTNVITSSQVTYDQSTQQLRLYVAQKPINTLNGLPSVTVYQNNSAQANNWQNVGTFAVTKTKYPVDNIKSIDKIQLVNNVVDQSTGLTKAVLFFNGQIGTEHRNYYLVGSTNPNGIFTADQYDDHNTLDDGLGLSSITYLTNPSGQFNQSITAVGTIQSKYADSDTVTSQQNTSHIGSFNLPRTITLNNGVLNQQIIAPNSQTVYQSTNAHTLFVSKDAGQITLNFDQPFTTNTLTFDQPDTQTVIAFGQDQDTKKNTIEISYPKNLANQSSSEINGPGPIKQVVLYVDRSSIEMYLPEYQKTYTIQKLSNNSAVNLTTTNTANITLADVNSVNPDNYTQNQQVANQQIQLTSASLDQARYNPGSVVNISYQLSNADAKQSGQSHVEIDIYKDNQKVGNYTADPTIDANGTQTLNYQWTSPNNDYQGYRAEINVNNQLVKTLGIDVSSDINKFPRYGAITEFAPGTNNQALLTTMKNLGINSLEYYDAYHTPQEPIPTNDPTGNYDQPWAVWLDQAAQTKSGQVVKDTVDQAHALGMDSMFYNMIYAITGNANDPNYLKSIGVDPTWLLHHADGDDKGQLFQFPMASYISDHNDPKYQAALQTYLDITNPDVVNWVVDKMGPVLKDLNFDGWHGDTIGNNDLMEVQDANGNVTKTYHVDDQLANFANMVKAKLQDKKFVVNTVSFGGEPDVAKSNTDFDYSEQWDGTYYSLDQKIKYINYLSGKSLVMPGYLQSNYASNHNGGEFNENAVLLMDAIVYGAGGSRMESVDGDHMLVGAFFPSKALNVSDDLKNQFQNYQTFITAYENHLRDGQSDNGNQIYLTNNNNAVINTSNNASPNTVYAYSRSSNNTGDTIQLINMLGVTSNQWQDNDGSRQDPTQIDNFSVSYYPKNKPQHVYLATPDGNRPNTSMEVPFTWQTDGNGQSYMQISVPFLDRWDMLYMTNDATNNNVTQNFNSLAAASAAASNASYSASMATVAQNDLTNDPVSDQMATFDQKWAYAGHDLGATYTQAATNFKVWAPTDQQVQLVTYDQNNHVTNSYTMTRGSTADTNNHNNNTIGTFSTTLNGDQNNLVYTYRVTHADGSTTETQDPYGVAFKDQGSKTVVVNLAATDPTNWTTNNNSRVTNPSQAIIAETHVGDFDNSDTSGVDPKLRSKLLGLSQTNTTDPNTGGNTGFDYVKKLGINYLELQPIAQSNYRTQNPGNYGWGYDTMNFNAVDPNYATDQNDPISGIKDFKQMIQAYHNAGINVMMDVVYNHVGGNVNDSSFEKLVPGYYFRKDANGNLTNGSYCGNDFASDHEMGRNFVSDSINYWQNEFGVDGFRFDLMTSLTTKTMQQISNDQQANHTLLFGEGWDMNNTNLTADQKADLKNANQIPNVGFYNGQFRDAVAGGNNNTYTGFASGNFSNNVINTIVNSIKGGQNLSNVNFANPGQNVNYVENHDDQNLNDKLTQQNMADDATTRTKKITLANAMNGLNQGITLFELGQEFQRSKNYDNNADSNKDGENNLNWDLATKNQSSVNAMQQIIAIKKQYPQAFSMDNYNEINQNLTIDHANNNGVISYTIKSPDGKFIVIYNGSYDQINAGNGANMYGDVNFNYGVNKASNNTIELNNGQLTIPDRSYVVYRFDN